MDKWLKDKLPDKDPYHNRGRDQMMKKRGGVRNSSACGKYDELIKNFIENKYANRK
jgi:hypothetical protein